MKRNLSKKIISAFCVMLLLCLTLLSGCGKTQTVQIGHGTPGEVAGIDWSGFDKLIAQIKSETDFEKRAYLMHLAEDMVMDTGAVIPLYYSMTVYLQNPEISGIYIASNGITDFANIRKSDGSKSIKIHACVEPATLDPSLNSTQDTGVVATNTMAGLYRCGENDEMIPALAKSCEISDDKCVYSIELKDNLKWSDGSPLTADDFVYSWKRAAQTLTGAQYGYMFNVIKGYPDNLEVYSRNDGKTLEVHLTAPCPFFKDLCAFSAFYPVKQSQVEKANGYKNAEGVVVNPGAWANEAGVISCGAYTVESWKHNESMILKKNPYYYDADKVSADCVELMLTSDENTAYNAFLSGNIDFTNHVPHEQLTIASQTPAFHKKNINGATMVMFNVKAPVFAGMTAEEAKTFRKAMSYVIDRQFIIDAVVMSGNQPANSIMPPQIKDGNGGLFKKNSSAYTYPYEGGYYDTAVQLDKARDMLRSIGFEFDENGKITTDLTVEYKLNSTIDNENIAACLQADLDQLGINLSVNSLEWNVFIKETRNGIFESKRYAWNTDYNDALAMLEIFTSDSSNNDAQLGK